MGAAGEFYLTLKVLSKFVAGDILKLIMLFSEKIRLGILCKLSVIHMKCQALFSLENIRKSVIHMKCQTLFSLETNRKYIYISKCCLL